MPRPIDEIVREADGKLNAGNSGCCPVEDCPGALIPNIGEDGDATCDICGAKGHLQTRQDRLSIIRAAIIEWNKPLLDAAKAQRAVTYVSRALADAIERCEAEARGD